MSSSITPNSREIVYAKGSSNSPAPLNLDSSGNLKVNVAAGGGSGGTSSTFGAAFPGTGTAVGASDGIAMQPLLVDGSGNLKVTGSLTVGGTTDNSAFTAGSGTGTPQMGFYHSAIDTVTDGDAAVTAITPKRAQHINLRDSSGNELGISSAPLQVSLANTGANATALKVDGSAVTQPVSVASLPLPTGASTSALQTTGNTSLSNIDTSTSAINGKLVTAITADYDTGAGTQTMQMLGVALPASGGAVAGGTATNPLRVDPTGTTTQPISAASLPLPTGAATAAKQPVLGTAGAASSDVITIQGIASMTAVKVDNSGVTQPVSGTVIANAGTGNFNENIAQVNGSTVATAATGVQKVGVVGFGGGTLDSAVTPSTAPGHAVAVGSLYNNTPPAPTDGQFLSQQADQAGNLRTFPGVALAALSAWTSATSLNATQTIFSNSGAPAVLVQVDQTSTLSAGAITFEVTYDGTNWVAIPANTVVDPTSTSYAQISLPYTVQASTNKPFLITSNGWQGLRIKLSTQITGSGSVTPNYALLPYNPVLNVSLDSATISENVAQFGGSNVATGTGASGSGIPRMTVSNDSQIKVWDGTTGVSVIAGTNALKTDLSSVAGNATTTAASGTQLVGIADGTGNALTSNSTTYTAKKALDANLLGTLGTAFSTAGKVDMKAADGDVFVRQATAANLNATVVGTGTFATQAAQSGTWTVQPGNTPNTSPWLTTNTPATSGGYSIYRLLSAATTNGNNIKGSAGQVFGWYIVNTSTSLKYVKLYNKATTPTVGTDTPVMTIPIPANTTASGGAGTNVEFMNGIAFGTGVGIGITGAVADNDTTAVSANDVICNLFYK